MEPYPETGPDLRRQRRSLGWSQQDLADALHVALRTVGNWERRDPPPDRIDEIGEALRARRAVLSRRLAALQQYPPSELLAAAAEKVVAMERQLRELAEAGGGGDAPPQ